MKHVCCHFYELALGFPKLCLPVQKRLSAAGFEETLLGVGEHWVAVPSPFSLIKGYLVSLEPLRVQVLHLKTQDKDEEAGRPSGGKEAELLA